MHAMPRIQTAIPLQRFQVGSYAATLLGEITSPDRQDYRYILAFVPQGQNQPSLYLCCERNQPPEPAGGAWRMRIVNSAMAEALDASDRWVSADAFAADALELGCQALGIGNGEVRRLR